MLHSTSVCLLLDRREWSCVYTVNDDDDDDDGNDVALQPFFENLMLWFDFGSDLRILTPYRVESIDKTLIFGLNTTIN